jgi:hypothetical protein
LLTSNGPRRREKLAEELELAYLQHEQIPQAGFLATRITLWQTTPNETDTWVLVKEYELDTNYYRHRSTSGNGNEEVQVYKEFRP